MHRIRHDDHVFQGVVMVFDRFPEKSSKKQRNSPFSCKKNGAWKRGGKPRAEKQEPNNGTYFKF